MGTDVRAAIARVLRAETNGWMWDFLHTIAVIPAAVVDGRIPEELLDQYPTDASYPRKLSRKIARKAGLKLADDLTDGDDEDADVTNCEAVGIAVEAMRALRTGDVGCHDVADGKNEVIQFYRDTVERNGLTIEAIREYVTGLSWTEAAQLFVDSFAVPIADSDPAVMPGTGGMVTSWLRPGDYSQHGYLDEGEYGIGIIGGVTEMYGTAAELAEFGQAVASRWQSPLVMALADLGDTIDEYPKFAAGLRCVQADALAKVLALSGQHDTAVKLIAEHSAADDECAIDLHADIHTAAETDEIMARLRAALRNVPAYTVVYESRDEAADAYVRTLVKTD